MMQIQRLRLQNWKNFSKVDIPLKKRMFIVGPNASGKSNLLDAFRFLHDISKPGGGLQQAVKDRGGISKIRSLAARSKPAVEIAVDLYDPKTAVEWSYELAFRWKSEFPRQLEIEKEIVFRNGKILHDRPNSADNVDERRLTQTYVEQIVANQDFRELVEYFESIIYRHLVPQLVRDARFSNGQNFPEDQYGQNFLDRVISTSEKTKKARLKKIEAALNIAVPQLEQLAIDRDEFGKPHLEVLYKHWRPDAGKQREDQFSDGTLRLIGLLWTILESEGLLLLEEPELSLHSAVISRLPALMHRIQKPNSQILISTHSTALLEDKGIGAEEVIVLTPEKEGTRVEIAANIADVKQMLECGMNVADVVTQRTTPENIEQLELFR